MYKHFGSKTFDILNLLFFALVGFITLYPFWNVAALSFNDPLDSIRGGIYFWPREVSLLSYQAIFEGNKDLSQAFAVSVMRTVAGTLTSIFSTTLLAFILSRKNYVLRKAVTRIFLLTMYINAGLIPVYILFRDLGLLNKFAVYIVPNLVGAFYLLVMRSFMQDIPDSLQEAAIIDGANDFQVFYKVVVPLCIPVIATIALYIAVWQWGQWQDTYFFAPRNKQLTTLQFEMVKIIRQNNMQATTQKIQEMAKNGVMTTPQSIQNAIIVIATAPILVVYPFLQKYFVSGLTLGAVKE